MNPKNSKNKRRKGILALGLTLLILIMASAVVTGQLNSTPSNKVFDITAKQFSFSPNKIYVNKGDTVTLRFTSKDVMHGFFIDGYEIKGEIPPVGGGSTEVTFVADKTGKFKFRCTVVCGYMHPFMIGEMVVEPNYTFMGSVALTLLLSVGFLLYAYMRVKKESDLGGR